MRTLPYFRSLARTRSALMLACSVCLAACGGAGSAAPRPESVPIPAVEAVRAREGVLPLVERVTGTVSAAGQVAIFPEASGPVMEVYAQNGDSVGKGDRLVRIQAAGSEAQLREARSNVAVAEAQVREIEANLEGLDAQYERSQTLGERGLVPREAVDTQRS
jgi:multidrug efflux pump subunit AcrA (membrane-fusion protein)